MVAGSWAAPVCLKVPSTTSTRLRSQLPPTQMARSPSEASRSSVSACSGPTVMSPAKTIASTSAASTSARTASSAGRLPWISSSTATRIPATVRRFRATEGRVSCGSAVGVPVVPPQCVGAARAESSESAGSAVPRLRIVSSTHGMALLTSAADQSGAATDADTRTSRYPPARWWAPRAGRSGFLPSGLGTNRFGWVECRIWNAATTTRSTGLTTVCQHPPPRHPHHLQLRPDHDPKPLTNRRRRDAHRFTPPLHPTAGSGHNTRDPTRAVAAGAVGAVGAEEAVLPVAPALHAVGGNTSGAARKEKEVEDDRPPVHH